MSCRRPFSVWCAPPRSFGMRSTARRGCWVATHCAADVFRMPWRKRDLPLEAARGVSSAPPKEPDSNVLAAVLSLPEKYRLPVHLFYYEGYSIAETAAVLGRRESTVRAQLTRARAMLREKLEVECI